MEPILELKMLSTPVVNGFFIAGAIFGSVIINNGLLMWPVMFAGGYASGFCHDRKSTLIITNDFTISIVSIRIHLHISEIFGISHKVLSGADFFRDRILG